MKGRLIRKENYMPRLEELKLLIIKEYLLEFKERATVKKVLEQLEEDLAS